MSLQHKILPGHTSAVLLISGAYHAAVAVCVYCLCDLDATYAGKEGKCSVYIEEVILASDKIDKKADLTAVFRRFGTVESVVVGFKGSKDAHVCFKTAASAVRSALNV